MRKLFLITLVALITIFGSSSARAELPSIGDGKVIINWSDFSEILQKLLDADVEPQPEPEPPVDFSFQSANFNIVLNNGSAQINADYSFEVFEDKEWVTVPIGNSSAGISGAFLDGKPAAIAVDGGSVFLTLKGKAVHSLRLTYTVAAPLRPGPNSFQVQVAQVPGATINMTAPADLTDISITNAVIVSTSKSGGTQQIKAVSSANNYLGASYTVPAPEAVVSAIEKLPTKLYSSMEMLVSIADDVTNFTVTFNYDIKHSPVSKFVIAVPKGYDAINATGQGVSGWKLENESLTVNVNYEIEGAYTLQVLLEAKRDNASGEVVVPELSTVGAERETGFIAIETRSSLEVSVGATDGLTPMDATELPSPLMYAAKYPILYAFRYARHPYSAKFGVIRHNEIEVLTAAIDSVNLVTVFTADGDTVTRMIYEVRNNKKQYLKIELPQKAIIYSAYLDDEPVKPSINDKGQILLPLKKSGVANEKASFTVEVIYRFDMSKMEKTGALKFVFPKADIPASEMLVSLYMDPKYKYWKFEGDLDESEPEYGLIADKPVPASGDVTSMEPAAPSPMPMKSKSYYSERAINRQKMMEKELADEIQQKQDDGATGYVGSEPMPQEAFQQNIMPKDNAESRGMLPVKFSVPLRGDVKRFSKLLVMDESPMLTFKYKKLRKPLPWKAIRLVGKVIFYVFLIALHILILRTIVLKVLEIKRQWAAKKAKKREQESGNSKPKDEGKTITFVQDDKPDDKE